MIRNTTPVLTPLVTANLPYGAANAETGRSLALILDASGSMNNKLPDGTTRIDAAKAAVADLAAGLPAETRLALRIYGHQSPTAKKDCKDTALVVPFAAAGDNRAAVTEAARAPKAQGYTPITYVLQLAAADIGKETAAESRVVVLVSDGKETCEGDPCAAAQALAAADAKLVVHTIGFGVDDTTRKQLQCVARNARGSYWDAGNKSELQVRLAEAANKPVEKREIIIKSEQLETGNIEIKNPDQKGHAVIDAATSQKAELIRPATGQKVDSILGMWPSVKVRPGVYNVTFGNDVWKSVEVTAGKTTVLEPGVLEIQPAAWEGHKILETETGKVLAEVVSVKNRATLIPARVSVTFGDLVWPDVDLKPGMVTTLKPGVIAVQNQRIFEYKVRSAEGVYAGKVFTGAPRLPVPAGSYVVNIDGKTMPVHVKEGEVVEIKIQ